MGFFLGPSSLAIYYIGTMLPAKIKPMIKPLLFIFFPRFSNNKMKLTKMKIVGIFGVSILLMLLFIVIIPVFIKIFFSQYNNSIMYGMLYSLIILFLPANVLFEFYFKGKKKLTAIKNTLVIPKIVNILLAIPALYLVGIYGLIILLILEQIITLLINIRCYSTMTD